MIDEFFDQNGDGSYSRKPGVTMETQGEPKEFLFTYDKRGWSVVAVTFRKTGAELSGLRFSLLTQEFHRFKPELPQGWDALDSKGLSLLMANTIVLAQ